jgi:hypothetical protein
VARVPWRIRVARRGHRVRVPDAPIAVMDTDLTAALSGHDLLSPLFRLTLSSLVLARRRPGLVTSQPPSGLGVTSLPGFRAMLESSLGLGERWSRRTLVSAVSANVCSTVHERWLADSDFQRSPMRPPAGLRNARRRPHGHERRFVHREGRSA